MHNKDHGSVFTTKINDNYGSNSRNCAKDCSEGCAKDFGHIELRRVLLDELYQEPYLAHPFYHNTMTSMWKLYFWMGMKKDITSYISQCHKFQKVKVEHQHPTRLLQPFPIPGWKWEII